jgi:hypothetical protein
LACCVVGEENGGLDPVCREVGRYTIYGGVGVSRALLVRVWRMEKSVSNGRRSFVLTRREI